MLEAEEEDYFNADDDEDFIPSIAAPLFPRGQSPSPPLHSLKRKRRTGLNISSGLRPALTPPRTPPMGSLVDYEDEDLVSIDDGTGSSGNDLSLPKRSLSPNVLSSPRLSNRQVSPSIPPQRPFLDDDEDNLLEALVRPKGRRPSPSIVTPKVPNLGLGPMRPTGKRRRDDDDDELLERLSSKAKRPDLGAEKVLVGTGGRAGSKPGDDPPKKIKLKFGLTSLGVAPTLPSLSSETGAKDGDTG
jgi:protein phosphatase-4 regulatory subunit 3